MSLIILIQLSQLRSIKIKINTLHNLWYIQVFKYIHYFKTFYISRKYVFDIIRCYCKTKFFYYHCLDSEQNNKCIDLIIIQWYNDEQFFIRVWVYVYGLHDKYLKNVLIFNLKGGFDNKLDLFYALNRSELKIISIYQNNRRKQK